MSQIKGPQIVLSCSWRGATLWLWPSTGSLPPFVFFPGTQCHSYPDPCLWGLIRNLFECARACACITCKSLPVGRLRPFLLWNIECGAPRSSDPMWTVLWLSLLAPERISTVLLCTDWNPQSQAFFSCFFPKYAWSGCFPHFSYLCITRLHQNQKLSCIKGLSRM